MLGPPEHTWEPLWFIVSVQECEDRHSLESESVIPRIFCLLYGLQYVTECNLSMLFAIARIKLSQVQDDIHVIVQVLRPDIVWDIPT